MKSAAELFAGRLRHQPRRDSDIYPRLINIGGFEYSNRRPLIKPTPANLRMFGKTPYARRAMNRIKQSIEMLEWEIVPDPGVDWNSELKRQAQVVTDCFKNPNDQDSFRSFVGQLVEDAMTNGAGCYEHQLGGDKSKPLWMWPVDSMSIQIYAMWDGSPKSPRYCQTLGYGNVGGIQGTPLYDEELVYARQNPTTESPFGLGELEVAFAAINRRLGVADYAGKMASNAQPDNMLVFEGMDDGALRALRDYWRNDIEGQGQTPIIATPVGAKSTLEKLRATDDKSLFIGYHDLLTREIATAFNIDAMCLNVSKDVNRSTAEVVDDMDWDNAVVPKATLVAAYLTHGTIKRKLGFTQLMFRFNGLKRDDKLAESEIYKNEYENNAITPNEYRERNGMPPMEGQWGDLTYADVQIATQAARGTGEIDDPDLPAPRPSKKPKSKEK